MKVLLFTPSFYTLHKTVFSGFQNLGFKVLQHDYRFSISRWKNKVNVQAFRFPFSIRNAWEKKFIQDINDIHINIFNNEKPDIVFIYNNEMLLPSTLNYFKEENTKIIFFLGDSPYYTPTNKHYLQLLFYGDLVVTPDSFWRDQLKQIGLQNIIVDFPGFDDSLINFREPLDSEKIAYSFDILFVGTGYANSWGYKRALFLSKFSDFNLKIFGDNKWYRWIKYFPELLPSFQKMKKRISDEQLIIMSKCAKVYPVDANPAILNGIHLRIFDCIAMGVLPIVEYRKDQDTFFNGVSLPTIKTYDQIKGITKRYLRNDSLRVSTLKELQDYTNKNYRADVVIKRLLEKI